MVKLQNIAYSAQVNPLGAELVSLTRFGKELIYLPVKGFWQRQSPVLFPIVGKLPANSYLVNTEVYQLNQHGFARDMVFSIVKKSASTVSFSLKSNAETLNVFPFSFELILHYTLNENGLSITYDVYNLSDNIMPFSIGAHPAFLLTKPLSNYSLHFNLDANTPSFGIIEGLLTPSSTINLSNLQLTENLFALDTIVFENLQSNSVVLLEDGKPYLTMVFKSPYFGVWKQKNVSFICLEPWWGVTSDLKVPIELNKKKGINLLPIKEKQSFNWQIT